MKRTKEEQRELWRRNSRKYNEDGRDISEAERVFYNELFERPTSLPVFTLIGPEGDPVEVLARSYEEAEKRIEAISKRESVMLTRTEEIRLRDAV